MDARLLEYLYRQALIQNKTQFLQMAVAARVGQADTDGYRQFMEVLKQEIFNLQHGITVAEFADKNREDLKEMGGG